VSSVREKPTPPSVDRAGDDRPGLWFQDETYTWAVVLDPMGGIGTTLVEAVRLGRRAVGVEYEPHWVEVANANLDVAREQGVGGEEGIDAVVFHGDARQLVTLLPPEYVGQASLVVTSPPYGPSTHGQVSVTPGAGVQKYHHLYGNTLDRGNLANIGHHRLLAGFTRILTALRTFLKPGGHIAITIRPWREHAELIDLPSQILACGRAAGLIPVERNVALLARAAETDLVFRTALKSVSSGKLKWFTRFLPPRGTALCRQRFRR
jgi:tRNA1(Val) A37 N6-methylase TrmN6